jgi:hypothetical protein
MQVLPKPRSLGACYSQVNNNQVGGCSGSVFFATGSLNLVLEQSGCCLLKLFVGLTFLLPSEMQNEHSAAACTLFYG